MLYDENIRDPLCCFFEIEYGKVRFLDEIPIGESRADMVMVTEKELIGIEIKSDADSYSRLPRQIPDYERYFDRNVIVIGSTHAKHITEHIPESWGIVVVNEEHGRIDFYELRKATASKKTKMKAQLELLWRSELMRIQMKNGLHKYSGRSRRFVHQYVLKSVREDQLKADLIDELYERDYTIFLERDRDKNVD